MGINPKLNYSTHVLGADHLHPELDKRVCAVQHYRVVHTTFASKNKADAK